VTGIQNEGDGDSEWQKDNESTQLHR
jgi:hypothetical protein